MLHAHTTQRFRKAITPAKHWQKRDDPVRVLARKHQKAVARALMDAFDKIAALAVRPHGHVADMSHAQVMKEYDPNQPRDTHGEWTTEGDTVTAFHGTKQKNLKSILKNGLTLGNPHAFKGEEDRLYEGERGQSVYVASTEELARYYAFQNSTAPAVLELRIPKSEFAGYTHDKFFQPQPGSAAYTLKEIKPEWIVGGQYFPKGMYSNATPIKVQKSDNHVTWWMVIDAPEDVEKATPLAGERGGLQVQITQPTSQEIQVLLKAAMDAVAAAGAEVAKETAAKVYGSLGSTAAEKFMAQWQDFMTDQIKEVTQEVQASIQQVVSAGAHAGLGPDVTARDIRDMIGLTSKQQSYVDSYRTALENLDSNALTRALRNTQNDERVSEAIESGDPLDPEVIDRYVQRYAESWRNYRTEMIARTELITANNAGARAGIDELIGNGIFGRTDMRRYWLVAMDEDTCPICLSIPELNPDGVGMDEDFDSDDGPVFAPTVHPNCRCSIAYRVVPQEDSLSA